MLETTNILLFKHRALENEILKFTVSILIHDNLVSKVTGQETMGDCSVEVLTFENKLPNHGAVTGLKS